jgi:hypothetical protein
MDRKNAWNVQPLRRLEDHELAEVSGACHRRHRKHRCHERQENEEGKGGGGLDLSSPGLLSLLQGNLTLIFQIITGNSGDVTAVAAASQANLAAP